MSPQQRRITEDEGNDVRPMVGYYLWAGPISLTVCVLLIAFLSALYIDDSRSDRLFMEYFSLALACLFVLPAWYFSIRRYGRIKQDIAGGIVFEVEGAPERTYMKAGAGSCHVRIQGIDLTIPNDRFNEVKDANLIRIAFLPRSRVVVCLEIAYGLGIR